ncbi:hypothetical protein D9757_005124 [Collybiopsis confluens]|uniref:Hydrophobin n=1 Tax=Collybiopsis confluens TaxID=2823264 RepID=A0A8H5HSV3_9AGAR|nr:hypothetical protein D9757_005124 [Collybiopsis confluens]
MQFKLAMFTAALATLAAATPTPRDTCSTGAMQCCNSLTTANDPAAASIIHSLGVVVQDVNAGVGLQCSPVIGLGSGGCKAQAVCCQNNSHGTLISIGCVPVQL